jgi:hypothetical protein
MSRNTEMERGDAEQQMAAYQRRIRKILAVKMSLNKENWVSLCTIFNVNGKTG